MSDLIATGLQITVLGMGVVFVLLTLLVFIVQWMSKFAHLVGGEPTRPAPKPAAAGDARLTAAITAAVHAYRSKHGRKR